MLRRDDDPMPNTRQTTLVGSAYFTFILIVGVIALGAWLVGSSPDQPIQAIFDNCKAITQKDNTDTDRKLIEYTCQLAIYTEHLATFTKWLVIVTGGLGAIGGWQAI